jgi:coenzyme F420 hydrogenase subunit beta
MSLSVLEARVLQTGQCTLCGACLSICPYLRVWRGRVVRMQDCSVEDGRCWSWCPRGDFDRAALLRGRFGEASQDPDLGTILHVAQARAADGSVRARAQNGGVVSALAMLALREGFAGQALVTARSREQEPTGRLVSDPDEVLACSGSGYAAGPSLQALHASTASSAVIAVALPCQTLALARMAAAKDPGPAARVRLVIGLFCTWALDQPALRSLLLRRLGTTEIERLEITPPPDPVLRVCMPGELYELPLDEARACIRNACRSCSDMTSELADISVGAVEGREGWCTVLVRSPEGLRLFERARSAGVLEIESLADGYVDSLRGASRQKKHRSAMEAP